MGKTSRWFRALFGTKKLSEPPPASSESDSRPPKEKKKWGIGRSFNANDRSNGGTRGSSAEASSSSTYVEAVDANKHAIAVAAATAAVAEAALAAAQAAAEVVRLTSGGSRPATAYVSGSARRRELAAVKIQSAFRAYLARRALRALKGLVKLQALVRGHIVRKQSADMLRRMQAMARIQARASANRAYMPESSYSSSKSSQSHQPGLTNPKKYDRQLRAYSTKLDGPAILKRCGSSKSNIKDTINQEKMRLGSNWLDHWMEECSRNSHRDTSLKTGHVDDEKSDKILEVDTWKPHLNSQRSDRTPQMSKHVSAWNYNNQGFTTLDSISRHSTKSHKPNPSLSSGEFLSLRSLKFPTEAEEVVVWTAENSPQVYSALSRPGSSARRGPFTPTRSECSRSFFSGYSSHPNYMANTESSRAKVRSQSAPRIRMPFEKPGSTKRFVHGFWDADTRSERGLDVHANFGTKAYPGSNRLDRLGMPVQGDTASFNSINGRRC
uniref:Putative IQ-domain 24 n=1 Tax=Davidia involucrata TaxID=16924 RepID=A0A5B7A0M7_DAVIN